MAASDPAAVDRGVLEKFLKTCIETMGSDATRKSLKNCTSLRPGPKIAEIEKRIWDDLGIPVPVGRQAVRDIETNFPEDNAALLTLKEEFTDARDMAYLRCLEDRQPSSLEKKAKMDKATVLEFFDACGVKLDTSEVRERLTASIKETGLMPESVVNDVHGEVMELLGWDREHGRRCFEDIGVGKEFADDREVARPYALWRGKTSQVCIMLLYRYKKEGGQLNVDDDVKFKLIEYQAKEELDKMSLDERSELLEKHAKKVNIVRKLPFEARKRYLVKVAEQEMLELAQCEILMNTLVQSQGWQERMAKESAKAE